jgi:hypothetical protein
MAFAYSMFTVRSDPRAAVVETLDHEVDEYWLLSEGVSMAGRIPPSTAIPIAPDGGDLIADFVDNIHRVVIVSAKARAVLEAELKPTDVEYLPFTLQDKKGRAVKEPYCLANTLRKVDCFDWKQSVYETYPNKPTKIALNTLRKLLLLGDRLPDDAKLFRVGELPKVVVMRSDLVDRLKAAGCSAPSLLAIGADIL